MDYSCSKCGATGIRLWRPAGRTDNLLCEEHLQEKQEKQEKYFQKEKKDIKLGLIQNKLVEFYPAVLQVEFPMWFYAPTKIPEDKYIQWQNKIRRNSILS